MTSILSGLDFYKLTMSQFAWLKAPDAQVTFTLKNRNPKQNLLKHVDIEKLKDRFKTFSYGFGGGDIEYLKSLKMFSKQYLNYLYASMLPTPEVTVRNGDLHVEVTGAWPLVTFWETVIMSTINDLYFEDRGPEYRTLGHTILSQTITALREFPTIKITDFGTRRRFSGEWQSIVIDRLIEELPGQFIGTSNPHWAQVYGIKPIGTFAHELPMVYGAMADAQNKNPLAAHGRMLDDWYKVYGEQLSIALTDTYGSDFFFETFGEERAHAWRGLRHDSGDPYAFANRALRFYNGYGINSRLKTIVFSDGLDLNKILNLNRSYETSFNLMFGWGTGLTNNVGAPALNIVMKATAVNGTGTVKLSDDAGKHTGSKEDIQKYLKMKVDILTNVH